MNFGGYLISVVSASALGILADLVTASYGKSGKSIGKYVKLATTLCILACILMPAIKSIDYDELFDKAQLEMQSASDVKEADSLYILRLECEEKASEYIFSKTGIKPISVSIEMELQEESCEPIITEARVIISESDADAFDDVRLLAQWALGTEVEVTYDE